MLLSESAITDNHDSFATFIISDVHAHPNKSGQETTILYTNTRFSSTTSFYSKVTDTNMTSDYETTTSSILINAFNRTDLAENGTGHPLTITIFFLNLNS